ncbi:MAG TPA: N-acetylmuramic acid 6-phosphate etherase [Candidatus Angelobacter sp.]|nr:N-acetylmuramic acid 6-phosphate etherase [Candidatus Angelobacter sp.]
MKLQNLRTEQQNRASTELDLRSALEIARIIHHEDRKVATAVEKAIPQIAQAIDAITQAIEQGGRLIYVGTGTSGRIAALDAAECPPTFNANPKTVQYVIAGGEKALARAVEFSEDSREHGRHDLARKKPGKKDVVVGITASGRTPYTVGAVEYARKKGALTVAVVCNPNSELGRITDIEIVADVGPEVLSGSTRMKAGTAQKMILNMLSTGAMAKLGYVYGNLMVNVQMKNQKLAARGLTILQKAAGVDLTTATEALKTAKNHVPIALIMLMTGLDRRQAQQKLKRTKGNVRKAIEEFRIDNL